MKLVVGLGNPGKEYENTRHNMGFLYLDYYTKNKNITIDKKKFDGLYGEAIIDGEKVLFLKPQKYMNLSGEVIKKYVDYFNIDIKDILIICDDLDTVIGKYRLRSKGSSGGHNGLKNIELMLNTQDYARLKIGISHDKDIDTKDYVLGKLDKKNLDLIKSNYEIVSDIIDDFYKLDMEKLMAKYNRK